MKELERISFSSPLSHPAAQIWLARPRHCSHCSLGRVCTCRPHRQRCSLGRRHSWKKCKKNALTESNISKFASEYRKMPLKSMFGHHLSWHPIILSGLTAKSTAVVHVFTHTLTTKKSITSWKNSTFFQLWSSSSSSSARRPGGWTRRRRTRRRMSWVASIVKPNTALHPSQGWERHNLHSSELLKENKKVLKVFGQVPASKIVIWCCQVNTRSQPLQCKSRQAMISLANCQRTFDRTQKLKSLTACWR